jgi:acyl carrier protein
MGLEFVEIVLAAEETFGIVIPDAEASRMRTPADLIAFVETHVPTVQSDECLTQQLFYCLRRGFRTAIPSLSAPFKPDIALRDVVSKDEWPIVWQNIRAAVGNANWPHEIPWPGWLRDGPKTVRQLIWHLVASLPAPSPGEPWSRERIEAEIRRILAETLNKKDFPLSAKFIGELGVH